MYHEYRFVNSDNLALLEADDGLVLGNRPDADDEEINNDDAPNARPALNVNNPQPVAHAVPQQLAPALNINIPQPVVHAANQIVPQFRIGSIQSDINQLQSIPLPSTNDATAQYMISITITITINQFRTP
eukprot:892669_1